MKKWILTVFVITIIALATVIPAQAQAPIPPGLCEDTVLPDGTIYRVCMPTAGWNGELVLFAHGYIDRNQPLQIPESQLLLPDGTYVPFLVNQLGMAFATSSYPENGLAVLSGVQDMRSLMYFFEEHYASPTSTFLVGASEGGLVTTLAIEQYRTEFSGGLAMCGPIGDFERQVNYWGDFRAAFDYFFKGVLPPTAINIPEGVMTYWETPFPNGKPPYTAKILQAISANPPALKQLLTVARAPTDPAVPDTAFATTLDVLWYNAFATNDGVEKLGGNPFDNMKKIYSGSSRDLLLNRKIDRYAADPQAVAMINQYYQTSGKLSLPLVTLHTTGDPVVPYWHATLYRAKTLMSGAGLKHVNIPILRYGHCAFNTSELLIGFSLLHYMTTGEALKGAALLAPSSQQQQEFRDLQKQFNLPE